jgi:hypothetical protein
MPMRKIPQAIYLNADEIEQLVKEREADADALPDGPERHPQRNRAATHVRIREAMD